LVLAAEIVTIEGRTRHNLFKRQVMKTGTQPRVALDPRLVQELYQMSHAQQYGLTENDFLQVLEQVAIKQFGETAPASEISGFLRELRLEELALARACAQGHQRAWDFFLTRYREGLYAAAYSIAREESAARELADSIYADLYGTRIRDGERVSKLSSYTGRGSLAGWLRTVLAQQHVDHYRKTKRMVSLEEENEKGVQFATQAVETGSNATPGEQDRLEQSTDEVLAQLSSEERFLLASYFLDGRTLAEIARGFGVHESTISRKLDKLTATVRKRIRDALVRKGMSRAQAEEVLQTDVRDVAINVRRILGREITHNEITQAAGSQTFSMKEKIVPDSIRGKEL
jgi:RNA polymerase sigma-70 factor, ECF subfamily